MNSAVSIIQLDGRTTSNLDWSRSRQEALYAIAQGKRILWHLNLGLFKHLAKPLSSSAQFLTLSLALEHFHKTIWEEFRPYTYGLTLYQGDLDLSKEFVWDDEQVSNFQAWLKEGYETPQMLATETGVAIKEFSEMLPTDFENTSIVKLFCRDVCAEYLDSLSERIFDEIPLFICFNAEQMQNPLLLLQLMAKERYGRMEPLLNSSLLNLEAEASLALCFPDSQLKCQEYYTGFSEALAFLQSRAIPFRLVSESHLNAEWDGLDFILCSAEGLSNSGKRRLHGFNAAGGTVVSLSKSIGLPLEMTFEQFKTLH